MGESAKEVRLHWMEIVLVVQGKAMVCLYDPAQHV